MKKKSPPDSILELTQTICQAAHDTKAEDCVVFDLRQKTSLADYLIISHGTNTRQVQAIADNVRDAVKKKLGRNPLGVEGFETAFWILIDYGDVVCHVFTEESRQFYRLEHLWHDVPQAVFEEKKKPVKKVSKKAAPKKTISKKSTVRKKKK